MVLGPSALAERSVESGGRDVKLAPYHRFELRTMLRPADAAAALAAHTEREIPFRLTFSNKKNDRRFEGVVSDTEFQIRRVLGYRNSFAPVTRGQILSEGGSTLIRIEMRPTAFAMVFISMFALIFLSVGLFVTPTDGETMIWFALPMVAVMYAITMGGFWWEAVRQEQVLREFFRAL